MNVRSAFPKPGGGAKEATSEGKKKRMAGRFTVSVRYEQQLTIELILSFPSPNMYMRLYIASSCSRCSVTIVYPTSLRNKEDRYIPRKSNDRVMQLHVSCSLSLRSTNQLSEKGNGILIDLWQTCRHYYLYVTL